MKKWLGRVGAGVLVVLLVAFVALAVWEPFWAERPAPQPDENE